ncbi:hypothetical protein MATL_G00068550 [Megalops atlanticus]|uniref:Methyl-CpG-binding domain protein 1-like n=1 Tax=Megalops atlanticus TaxID=7932 RepID=A0A9D3Q4X5_MEGAT|nr:hypothetical protein MATL_G00068550 [Megalops atlanticus]
MNEGLPNCLPLERGGGDTQTGTQDAGGGATETEAQERPGSDEQVTGGETLQTQQTVDGIFNRTPTTSPLLERPESQEKSGSPAISSCEGAGGLRAEPGEAGGDEPPVDWLEPLEEDYDDEDDEEEDRHSWELDLLPTEHLLNGHREVEVESLAGESERSGSVAGSERNDRKKRSSGGGQAAPRRRRRQAVVDEEWEEWPILGQGWKRKEVFRRSGFSVGKTDTYYMSPGGDRLRSKIELAKHLAGIIDVSTFDFKSGMFLDENTYRRMRRTRKYRRKEHSVSTDGIVPVEQTVEPASTPDSLHSAPQRQPPGTPRSGAPQQSSNTSSPCPLSTPSHPASPGEVGTPPHQPGHISSHSPRSWPPSGLNAAVASPSRDTQALPQSSDPPQAPVGLASVHEGDASKPSQASRQQPCSRLSPSPVPNGCSGCGRPYAGVELRRPSHAFLCPDCKQKKGDSNQNIIFRKWLPCGRCRACLVTEDCGMCASCRSGLVNRDSCKPIRCRRRKCVCPIRKKTAKKGTEKTGKTVMRVENSEGQLQDGDVISAMNKVRQYATPKHSDFHEFTMHLHGSGDDDHNDDNDEDDCDYDDDDDLECEAKRRSRRACGRCNGCLHTTDCGSCDFCVDNPKFGGSNKKRQKCRLRQCQRQAMRHLLPLHLGRHEGWVGVGRPRPHYRYSGRRAAPNESLGDYCQLSEDEDEEWGSVRPGGFGLEEEADTDSLAWMSQRDVYPSSGKLDKEVYISNYEVAIQNCFRSDSKRMDIWRKDRSPARVFEPSQHLLPLTDPDAPGLPVGQGTLPVSFSKTGERGGLKEQAGVDLDEDVAIVEVDTEKLDMQETTPMITQIFSLADSAQTFPPSAELQRLLDSLRRMVLPAHWVGLLADGPCLQVVQCSKLSTMADTMLHIYPDLGYQLSVQGQPLLSTHPLYQAHPPRLLSVPHVVALLLDLERHAVCRGLPEPSPTSQDHWQPVHPKRAATCHFLVLKAVERCHSCRVAPPML